MILYIYFMNFICVRLIMPVVIFVWCLFLKEEDARELQRFLRSKTIKKMIGTYKEGEEPKE